MNAREFPQLETDRLRLRAFALTDAADVKRLAGDWQIADTTLNIPHPYEDGMAELWIANHPKQFAEEKGVTLAITLKREGTLIGAISLMNLVKDHQAELGYWVNPAFWNQGICTEAGRILLQYAFTELGLIRIHASHLTRNPASGRVMEKLGLRHEGSRRQHRKKWDIYEDQEVYGILKTEWVGGPKLST